jgi:hypothetical protein
MAGVEVACIGFEDPGVPGEIDMIDRVMFLSMSRIHATDLTEDGAPIRRPTRDHTR